MSILNFFQPVKRKKQDLLEEERSQSLRGELESGGPRKKEKKEKKKMEGKYYASKEEDNVVDKRARLTEPVKPIGKEKEEEEEEEEEMKTEEDPELQPCENYTRALTIFPTRPTTKGNEKEIKMKRFQSAPMFAGKQEDVAKNEARRSEELVFCVLDKVRLSVCMGDLTTEDTEAIVNAANSR